MKRSEKLYELYLKAQRLEARWARRKNPAFLWRKLAIRICDDHGVTLRDVLGPSSPRHLVHARWQIMFELRQRDWTFAQIGRVFGRDHTSVMHGVKAHGRKLEEQVLEVVRGMEDVSS
jgi:chromosomal replication initiation ATPase DnaA